jgi:chemotaxis protein CheD
VTPARRNSRYLQPGELLAHDAPTTLLTIVGSCVAVCIFDPTTSIGGATHYLLPKHLSPDGALRYGVVAIPRLVRDLVTLGACERHLAAKVFGGARMIASQRPEAGRLGAQNVELAYRILGELRVPIVASDVHGTQARRIVFRTDDGAVWLRRL